MVLTLRYMDEYPVLTNMIWSNFTTLGYENTMNVSMLNNNELFCVTNDVHNRVISIQI